MDDKNTLLIEPNEINETLSESRVKLEYWDWIRRYSLKTNKSYIKSALDILIDIQFKGFYTPKKTHKDSQGYSRNIQLAQIEHLIDCRVIKKQEIRLSDLIKPGEEAVYKDRKKYYVAGPEFQLIFKSKTKLAKKTKATTYKKVTDDDGKKYKVAFKHESRFLLARINDFNSRHRFEIDDCVFDSSLCRIFGRDDSENGRFHAQYQQLSETKRERIKINGEETVERDFSQMHISLLYRKNGFIEPKDLYEQIYPKDRSIGKMIVCICMYAGSIAKAKAAIQYHLKLSEFEVHKAILKVKEFPLLMSTHALRILRLESEISLKIMSELISKGIPVLNIHDSFIVALKHKDELDSLMQKYLKPGIVIDISSNLNKFRDKSN